MQPLTTPAFSVPAKAFVKAEASQRLWQLWWVAAIPLAALAIAGAFDTRFIYLALMVLFIVYPMAVSLTWMALVAHPSMRLLLRPTDLTAGPDGDITVRFYPYRHVDAKANEDAGASTDTEANTNGDDKPVATLTLTHDDIKTVETSGAYHMLTLTGKPMQIRFLLIPADMLPAENLPQTNI